MKRLVVSLCLGLLACGGTERSRITIPITAVGDHSNLVTDSGWTVTLTQATAHFEALRFFEGKVLLSRHIPWWRNALIGTAVAHPGHYIPGEALGELIAPLEVDLLAETPVSWGTADGVTADYGSAQLTYGGDGVVLEGTATKDGTSVDFSARFLPPLDVEGIKYEATMTTTPGAVQVAVDLHVILSRIDFAATGSGAMPLDTTSPAFNGFGRGVEDTSAYVITHQEQ